MPSPNGYFDCGTAAAIDRNWFRYTITHDVNSPPWLPGQAGSYEFEVNIGTAAAGPFTAAPITGPGTDCATPDTDNRFGPGGVSSTVIGVGGPAELLAGTDYWLEIILRDPNAVEVDRFVCGPTRTLEYPTFVCLPGTPGPTSETFVLGGSSGRVNITDPCNHDTIVWELATTPGGPYTPAPSEPVSGLSPSHTFTGLTAGTQYYVRARLSEQAQSGGEYLVTPECTFTTAASTDPEPPEPPPFHPLPCAAGSGAGGADVEQIVLCDLDAEGNLLGTALAVYEYDADGNPAGAPTFVNPTTGTPYVPQGTLQPCPDAACLPPMQFCQTSTTTGPVEHPGRQYDITLPLNQGFTVDSLQVDAVTHAAGVTWSIFDVDGSQFASDLQAFIQGRMPAGTTVTVTNPNAGATEICGPAQPFAVHIECVRLDQSPPNLVELVYNGGEDLVRNPPYNEVPPFNIHQPCGFHLPKRQDQGGTLACTSVANRGWETNDSAQTFEIWCDDVRTGQNTTPTPRGTPVQEISSFGSGNANRATIWQTFQVPAAGNFNIRVVHGARDPGEEHRITLSSGDTDDNPVGDIITDISTPPSVTAAGGPNPWTTFSQTQALAPGVYTLALSTTNPITPVRGGLFTDMRVYLDRPGLRATATTDDETCVVTTQETTTNTVCSFWQPQCAGGVVVGWQKTDTGETLSNAAFWAQVPAPQCCRPEVPESGDSGSGLSNMLASDLVCVTIGGISSNAIRLVVTDPSGGTLQESFLGVDGTPVNPDSWTPGGCTQDRFMADQVLCDFGAPGGTVRFLRKYVQTVDVNGFPRVDSHRDFALDGSSVYLPVGPVGTCGSGDTELVELCDVLPSGAVVPFVRVLTYDERGTLLDAEDQDADGGPYVPAGTVTVCSLISPEQTVLCDDNGPFMRTVLRAAGLPVAVVDTELDATTPYAPVGTVGSCSSASTDRVDAESFVLCDSAAVPNRFVRTYAYDAAGVITGFTDRTLAGAAFVPTGAVGVCAQTIQSDTDFVEEVLCDSNGTAFIRLFRFNSATGALISTTNTTLAGAAFAPVGVVGLCSDCCPTVVGNGCTNTGSGFYTAIRATNGTISLIDSVTGAAVLAANIVACPSDNTVVTLTAQHRLIADADAPWTPGADVAGTLTSVTYTVLSGTATVTDQNGTVAAGIPAGMTATWNVEDNNALSGPQSIDAVGGQIYVHWTQR
jgi:hypothetical protein